MASPSEGSRPGLDGAGGLHAAGRWHLQGSRVIYFGASAAIVVLERLAHIDAGLLPADLILARYDGDVSVADLAPGEVGNIDDPQQTRARGNAFLKAGTACVLRVPSVIVPEACNLVVNPLHPDAVNLRLVQSRDFTFDGRLL